MKANRWHHTVTADLDPAAKPDVVINLDTDAIPFAPEYFDTAVMCNVLEHLKTPQTVLSNVHTVLRSDGVLYGVVPFLVGVHPNPHDYTRFTREGLHQMLARAGFKSIEITPVGCGPMCASYYQSEFLLPRVLKLFVLPLVFGLDHIVLRARPAMHEKFPLSYAFRAMR
jgi:SAM-dependent methyltransferase